MKLIVGLGNPESFLKKSRHNIGFNFLDYLVRELKLGSKWKDLFGGKYISGKTAIFLKPWTGMNDSGKTLKRFCDYFKIKKENLLLVYDDLAIPFGFFRCRERGSSGGHNGVKSVFFSLSTENIQRVRIGIGSKDQNANIIFKKWVLDDFTPFEEQRLEKIFNFLSDEIINWIKEITSFEQLMNTLNRRNNV